MILSIRLGYGIYYLYTMSAIRSYCIGSIQLISVLDLMNLARLDGKRCNETQGYGIICGHMVQILIADWTTQRKQYLPVWYGSILETSRIARNLNLTGLDQSALEGPTDK